MFTRSRRVQLMPRCPSCRKILPSDNAVLRHLNQSTSRCHGWVDSLIQIGEHLEEVNSEGNGPSPELALQASPARRSFGREQMDIEQPEMDVDQPEEPYQGAVEQFPGAASIFLRQPNSFLERFDRDRFSQERRSNLYYPFASRADWEMGLWLTRSGLSMAAIDSLLSLELVSLYLSFDFDN